MLNYAIDTGELNQIMGLLHRVLDIRITFFDLQQNELDGFDIKEMSEFCRRERRDPAFEQRCVECDQTHLKTAKQTRQMHLYRCHAGLWEGIIPLYDKRQIYLGAIVFGQIADADTAQAKMADIGNLLKYLSEYIGENELIRYRSQSWAASIARYLDEHLAEPVTLAKLAKLTGKSTSFLSHNIPSEFGMTLKAYVRAKRLTKAVELLAAGKIVRECAYLLGYYDEFYFSKEFKRFHGYVPSAVKKSDQDLA